MATDQSFVDYIAEQANLPTLTYKKMFGEYAVYVDGKVVAFACDNSLFLKPTEEARVLIPTLTEAEPYPKAKPHFLIDEYLEEPELLRQLLLVSAAVLPVPKPKKPRTTKKKGND